MSDALFATTGPSLLVGEVRRVAEGTIRRRHYTRSIPSGKSHYIGYEDAIVVWSLPANKNLARFVLGYDGTVWELSRLWAPDGHERNLLTQAISAAVSAIRRLENPDALVSFADPNVGHLGGVYRAASWIYHGRSEEGRGYVDAAGQRFARRAFHSGGSGMTRAQIEERGLVEQSWAGKERFVRPLSRRARRAIALSSVAPEGERNR